MKDDRYLINGDEIFIKEFDGNKIILGVIDGTGQGKLAHELANVVKSVILKNYKLPLDQIVMACDEALRKSELEGGATIAIGLIHSDKLEYIGIGDTHSYIHQDDHIKPLKNQEGRLGEFQLPKLVIQEYPLVVFSQLIFCTDGINTHVEERLLPLATKPQIMANFIFNTYHRVYGDATTLVAQYQPRQL